MKNDVLDRRTFPKSAVASSAAAVIGTPHHHARAQGAPGQAQQRAPPPVHSEPLTRTVAHERGRRLSNLKEHAFVDAPVGRPHGADRTYRRFSKAGLAAGYR